jgi:HEAT repeat protein
MGDSVRTGDWGERTAADLASLLVELGRVWKAATFYGTSHPTTRSLSERTCRAWQSDLARAGPLELEVIDTAFQVHGLAGPFGSDHLGDIARGLAAVGVQRIRFTEVLSCESLIAFVGELCQLDAARRPSSQLGIEVDGEICLMLDSTGDMGSASEAIEMSMHSLGNALLRTQGALVEDGLEPADAEKPSVDESPLLAPATDPDSARLVACLRELDRCTEDDSYIRLASRVAETARALCDDGRADDANRAMLVLADHSVGDGGRSGVQARVARATLLELSTGERLSELIDRACSSDTSASVRAAQVLLTLGEHAVPALLERLEDEQDGRRAGQLTGLLIALAEATVPALTAAIGSGTGRRARLGIQIAGDLQCPGLVQPLRDLLCAKDGSLQREAARALVEMGNSAALRALLEALESKHDRSVEIAAFSLGTLGSPRSLSALVRRLERATQERRWNVAREILLAIAQFHQGDRATARALVAWVHRGGPPWRRPDLDLKFAAVSALGQLGGPHSAAALGEIAGLRLSPKLCEHAKNILERRGDGRVTPE